MLERVLTRARTAWVVSGRVGDAVDVGRVERWPWSRGVQVCPLPERRRGCRCAGMAEYSGGEGVLYREECGACCGSGEVRVGVRGRRDGGVPKRLGHDDQRHSSVDAEGRREVAQVMHDDARDAGGVGQFPEPVQDALRTWRSVAVAGEHEPGVWIVALVGAVRPREGPASSECLSDAWGESDPILAGSGLCCTQGQAAVVDGRQRVAEVEDRSSKWTSS